MRYAIVYFSSMTALFVAAIVAAGCQGVTVQTPSSEPAVSAPVGRVALSWENTTEAHPERAPWSDKLLALIEADFAKFQNAKDISSFCPKFGTLDRDGQKRAIAELIVAVIYHESAYSPVSRMKETTMGTDPVTGQHVYSEGLLQLSYQDQQWAPWCKFDWSKDKLLAPTDPKKTILDPFINLECGVPIMANIAKNKGAFAAKSGFYWAVLIPGGRYSQLDDIKARVKAKAPGCQ